MAATLAMRERIGPIGMTIAELLDHRRADLLYAERLKILDELAALSQEAGLYGLAARQSGEKSG